MQINEYLYLAGVLNDREYHRSLSEGARNISCDICNNHAGDKYVDGATKAGPWASMCMNCWAKHGVGKLGIGYGQMYDNKTGRQLDGGSKGA